MKSRRWQDWINLLLGIWLFISPWAMRYSDTAGAAAWNAWILGVAIVVFAAVAMSISKAREEVINIILGVWMVISPWILQFSTVVRNAEANAVIVGILVIIFASWSMALARQQVELHEHVAP